MSVGFLRTSGEDGRGLYWFGAPDDVNWVVVSYNERWRPQVWMKFPLQSRRKERTEKQGARKPQHVRHGWRRNT